MWFYVFVSMYCVYVVLVICVWLSVLVLCVYVVGSMCVVPCVVSMRVPIMLPVTCDGSMSLMLFGYMCVWRDACCLCACVYMWLVLGYRLCVISFVWLYVCGSMYVRL